MPALVPLKDDVTSAAEALARRKAMRDKFFPPSNVANAEAAALRVEVGKLKARCADLERENRRLTERVATLNNSLAKAAEGLPDIPDGVTIRDIQAAICMHFRMPRQALISGMRKGDVVRARQIAFIIAKKLTGCTLPQIGRAFGGKDHTTILYGCQKMEPAWLAIEEAAGGKSLQEIVLMMDIEVGKREAEAKFWRLRGRSVDNRHNIKSDTDTFRPIGEVAQEIVETLKEKQRA